VGMSSKKSTFPLLFLCNAFATLIVYNRNNLKIKDKR